jgi:6-phosphogluconate dehydrogenase
MLMVKRRRRVDAIIENCCPCSTRGHDRRRRQLAVHGQLRRRVRELARHGVCTLSAAASPAARKARATGRPSCPAVRRRAWPALQPDLQAIAARSTDEPCCQWVGEEGAGHYVKMIHNGIEYGDMQLIARPTTC